VAQLVLSLVRISCVSGRSAYVVIEATCEGARGRAAGLAGACEAYYCRAYCDAVLAVVDASAVGEDVNFCAFWSEFATALFQHQVSLPPRHWFHFFLMVLRCSIRLREGCAPWQSICKYSRIRHSGRG